MDVIDNARALSEEASRLAQQGRNYEACRAMLRAFHGLHVAGLDVAALGAMEQAAVYARRAGDRQAIKQAFGELVSQLRARDGDDFANRVQAAMMSGLTKGATDPQPGA